MDVEHHKDLKVWKLSMDLAVNSYRMTQEFPRSERFGLVSQIRRAAVSVPANIAEGAARGSRAEFARFISIARGSIAELETHILLSHELGFVRDPMELLSILEQVRRMLIGLHRSLAETGPRGAPPL